MSRSKPAVKPIVGFIVVREDEIDDPMTYIRDAVFSKDHRIDGGRVYDNIEEALEDSPNDLDLSDGEFFFAFKVELSNPEKYEVTRRAVRVPNDENGDE
jgi:hypothetical protein